MQSETNAKPSILSRIADKVMHSGGWFTFIRSSISSQIASWIDMGTSFVFYAWVLVALDPFYRSNLSVAIGAIIGGIVNCCINYRFTFHAKGQSVRSVAVKYAMVWIGSLLLNMYGTTGLGALLTSWKWLTESAGFTADGIFATARLTTSLVVSLAWNFLLQRSFVYRPSAFDPYAIRFVNIFVPQRRRATTADTDSDN